MIDCWCEINFVFLLKTSHYQLITQIKHEEFTFTLGDTMMIPTSDRYGVMLKTISESYLPKRVQIVTESTQPDSPTTPGKRTSSQSQHSILFNKKQSSIKNKVQ